MIVRQHMCAKCSNKIQARMHLLKSYLNHAHTLVMPKNHVFILEVFCVTQLHIYHVFISTNTSILPFSGNSPDQLIPDRPGDAPGDEFVDIVDSPFGAEHAESAAEMTEVGKFGKCG